MFVILSQKIDSDSEYKDELFKVYHYPARYRNQLHEGDTFIYYQGNRFNIEQRYYFGIGTIEEITTTDGESYFARLTNCRKFEKKVPIYLSDGRYVEQLGYESVRKSPRPPWQSSIRPLSQQAYNYIISAAGRLIDTEKAPSVDELKEKLKDSVRSFFRDNNVNAILEIESTASAIAKGLNIYETVSEEGHTRKICAPDNTAPEKFLSFLTYCKTTRMTYSYKPVLLLAFIKYADKDGHLGIDRAVKFFREFYQGRRDRGLITEINNSIYQNNDISDNEIRSNLINNPIKALVKSGYFFFDSANKELIMSPELWSSIGDYEKAAIGEICRMRLKQYYNE